MTPNVMMTVYTIFKQEVDFFGAFMHKKTLTEDREGFYCITMFSYF